MWRPDEVIFDIVAEGTDDPVISVSITTPAGVFEIMAECIDEGRTLRLKEAHIQSEALDRTINIGVLRSVAEIAMERMDYDELIIEGSPRTTGARPGHRPRPLRFLRRSNAPEGEDPD